MPYVSDSQLAALANTSAPDDRSEEGEAVVGAVPLAGAMGVAGLLGLIKSKLEDPATGRWLVPGTNWDAETVLFLALAGVAFGGKYVGLGQWSKLASIGALGVGGNVMRDVGHRFGKTGRLTIGSGVPPWDTTSFDPTQLGNPYDDVQSQGLSSSGV